MSVKGEITLESLKPKSLIGFRHVQGLLLFFALFLAFSMRNNMSMAIVAMTDEDNEDTFDWNIQTQSVILSSFFWGYIFLQVPGGELARRIGGKILLVMCIGINSAVTLIVPIGAYYGGWQLVCACRVIQGLSQGVLYPTIHNLIVKWIPLEEKNRLGTFIYAAIVTNATGGGTSPIGQLINMLCSFATTVLDVQQSELRSGAYLGNVFEFSTAGFVADYWGWPSIFYVVGIFGAIWTVAYAFLGASTPQEATLISDQERLYIHTSLGHTDGEKKLKTPWRSIFTSVPFIALTLTHCGQNWGFWTLMTEIPSYMKHVLNVDIKLNGMMSSLPYLVLFILSFPFGFISDYVTSKKWLSVTTTRKISNSIGLCGPAIFLIVLSNVGDNITIAVTILTIVVGINVGHLTGFLLVHTDMAPNFAGTMMGITNGCANVMSIIAPLVAGAILKDENDASQWRIVFYVASVIYVVANTIFLVFGTCEKQKWNEPESEETDDNVAEKGEKSS